MSWPDYEIHATRARKASLMAGKWKKHNMHLAIFAIRVILPAERDENEESAMATRNISLTPEQDAFVESVVKAGVYQNASEAVRDALRVLQQRRREDELKLKALRLQIKAGAEAIARGDYIDVDDSELDDFLDGLSSPTPDRARK
jgi:antitoxin ParD1/3/4